MTRDAAVKQLFLPPLYAATEQFELAAARSSPIAADALTLDQTGRWGTVMSTATHRISRDHASSRKVF